MTGEILTEWGEIGPKDYHPRVLVDHPLPAGAAWSDLSGHRSFPSPNLTLIAVSRAPQAWFDAVEAASPGSVIDGPYEDDDAEA